MKILIFILGLALMPLSFVAAQTDYYLEFDGVDGETTTSSAPTRDVVDSGEDQTKKGNVEYTWKVEEGESAPPPGVEPDEIDSKFNDDDPPEAGYLKIGDIKGETQENTTAGIEPDEIDVAIDDDSPESNFAILLSSSGDDASEESRQQVAEILKEGLAEADVPTEQISLNYEKITTTHHQPVKLFGLIPVKAKATVEIDVQENIKVKFPWWAVFAAGKNSDSLGQKVFTTLSNILKTKHDTIKNAINNVR
ncbi:MAG: hypothetical protein A3A24_03795 [Candidatus Buchananbacteria bacterium RIFCSPLOWO2_01_FULL_46_12]|uniref:Uncharacterized protein n=2 Tax=Candidatus Buchananiibacteriota TaxID=1817903 RepID=A0A1G1YND8_9BACT|nr:MAG: hypothetical protein A2744_03750 [Candidatus Buchananbacteria bacterium RIFCSPHIGHO2_01_FULL_44_11]OGY53873.1 MAG: hypothetical protein A3A24_03795 [Candidatus Buchananbacteria bacterium RIFCSPLOWO2_01_FULL_46_12]